MFIQGHVHDGGHIWNTLERLQDLNLMAHVKFLSMDIMCGFKRYSTYVNNVDNNISKTHG
jgi:hypothetical protein